MNNVTVKEDLDPAYRDYRLLVEAGPLNIILVISPVGVSAKVCVFDERAAEGDIQLYKDVEELPNLHNFLATKQDELMDSEDQEIIKLFDENEKKKYTCPDCEDRNFCSPQDGLPPNCKDHKNCVMRKLFDFRDSDGNPE